MILIGNPCVRCCCYCCAQVWNRTDEPLNPSKGRDEFTARLFPFWILVSEFAFKDLEGKEGYERPQSYLLRSHVGR